MKLSDYKTDIRFSDELKDDINYVKKLKERYIINDLKLFIYSKDEITFGKVCILYGLRRTGKTTMMFQLIADMNESMQNKSVYINCTSKDNVIALIGEILSLINLGYKYFFIDEVTKMPDFISLASLFADRLAKSDIRIILTGTDSLSLWLAKCDELFDRNFMIHTTYIPFYDFKNIFPNGSIDEFIEYGGTLSHENNKLGYFQNEDKTYEYIDNAICDNILHSLAYYEKDGVFSDLYPYYSRNELKNIIHRIIQSDTHKFVKNVVLKKFKMADYGLTVKNLAKRNLSVAQEMLDNDQMVILDYFKKELEIFDINEKINSLNVFDETVKALKLYLEKLDIVTTTKCLIAKDEKYLDDKNANYEERTILSQIGIRFNQAKKLVESIENYYKLETSPKKYKTIITEEILNCVKGGLLEDLITVNCIRSLPKCYEVFKIMFNPLYGIVKHAGEYDMVIYDKQNHSCELFEIKHDSHVKDSQIIHLIDIEKINWIASHYGTITKKAVIYLGENTYDNEHKIYYINANDFLDNLKYYDKNYVKLESKAIEDFDNLINEIDHLSHDELKDRLHNNMTFDEDEFLEN